MIFYFVKNSESGVGIAPINWIPHRSYIMNSAANSIEKQKLPLRWIDALKLQQTCEQLFGNTALTTTTTPIVTTTITKVGENDDEDDVKETTSKLNKDEVIFVLDSFQGSAAYEYLSRVGCRIISPFVVKKCDKRDSFMTIPLRPHALFSLCMQKAVVTATNLLPYTRQALQEKVLMMGGTYSSEMNSTVTVLVANSVTTEEYRLAFTMSIPVVKAEWVEHCWSSSEYLTLVRGDGPGVLRRYALPIFHELIITCSGIDVSEKNKVKLIVGENGGTYSPFLCLDKPNAVLVLQEPTGLEYFYAKKKQIPRLRLEWLNDSEKAGYALPFDSYSIDAGGMEAVEETPVVPRTVEGLVSTKANVTNSSTQHLQSIPNSLTNRYLENLLNKLLQAVISPKEDRNTAGSSRFGSGTADFLEDAVIIAVGFDENLSLAIRKTVCRCGALFCSNFLEDIVTHVIVGPEFSRGHPLFGSLVKAKKIEKMVTIDWLIVALESAECVNNFDYLHPLAQQFY